MTTLNIDGREYETEQLSDAAKAQLANIKLDDQKNAQLKQGAFSNNAYRYQ